MYIRAGMREVYKENTCYHENYHIQQQDKMGWVEFYMRTAHEYLKYGFSNTYGTPGTLEYEADRYAEKICTYILIK